MNLRILGLGILVISQSAGASHFVECELTAVVKKISVIDRLGGTVVHSRNVSLRDVEETILIEVLDSKPVGSSRGCPAKGYEASLLLSAKEVGTLKENQGISLSYSNRGDRLGSSITWELK